MVWLIGPRCWPATTERRPGMFRVGIIHSRLFYDSLLIWWSRFDHTRVTRALPDGSADRVHLGLLPSSEEGWPIAVRLLRPRKGGWMHVHANVIESSIPSWVERVVETVERLGGELGKEWGGVHCRHLEKVKSYAPRVWHVVADIECCEA